MTVDVGSKVQSIPGPGEKPQIFETIEKIEARPEWNEMRPRLTAPVSVDAAMTVVHLEGTGTNLRKGDMLLFLGREVSGATRAWDLCRVADVELEVEKKRTRVALNNGPIHFPGVAGADVQVFAMRLRAALFGYNAPDRRVLPDTTLAKFDAASVLEISSGGATGGLGGVEIALGPQDWKFKVSGNTVDLDTVYPAITVGSRIALSTSSRSVLARVTAAGETGRTDYTLTGKVTRLTVEVVANPEGTTIADFGGSALRGTSVLGDSQELRLAAAPVPPTLSGTTIVVAQRIEQFRRDRKLAITGTMPVTRESFSGIFSVVTTERAGDFTYF